MGNFDKAGQVFQAVIVIQEYCDIPIAIVAMISTCP